ncbi:hypothetical protein M378DRAFT_169159, partial [Amanita muscaria Koide BX008]
CRKSNVEKLPPMFPVYAVPGVVNRWVRRSIRPYCFKVKETTGIRPSSVVPGCLMTQIFRGWERPHRSAKDIGLGLT